MTVGLSAVAETGEGMIAQSMYSVEIECLPDALVSQIEVDLALIATPTDSIYISDLDVPEGVTILADDDALVARFQTIRATLEEEEEGEEEEMEELDADAVEVISKESEEEF